MAKGWPDEKKTPGPEGRGCSRHRRLGVDVYGKAPDWLTQRRAGKVKFADRDFEEAVAKFADPAAKGYLGKTTVSRDHASTGRPSWTRLSRTRRR